MRLVVLLLSLCMPAIAWFSQRGTFGPTNGAVSDRYPTLLVAAGWAFSIWGLIFLLDIAYGIAQATGPRRRDPALARMAPWSALGFAATAAWMPLFSTGAYWLCVLVIFTALFGTARAAAIACSERKPAPGIARWALPLHAGWLTLASFLNLAQTIVAYRLLSTDHMLGWSLVLLVLATVLLLWINRGLRSLPYAAAAAWGLGAAYARQSQSSLPGAETAALAAMVAATLVVAQLLWFMTHRRRHPLMHR